MVQLRKRKAAAEPAAPPPPKKANSVQSVKSTTSSKKGESSTNGSAPVIKVSAGDSITLEGFGGDVETNEGEKVTLKKLVDESKTGVVLFTYPKASTPGCKYATLMYLKAASLQQLRQDFQFFCIHRTEHIHEYCCGVAQAVVT